MPKILIAEDEPDIRDLIAFTLQFGGFEAIVTSNGQEAIARAVETRPDLILLDVRMPRMTGYEACAALKANPKTAHIPIAFLSAKGQEDEVRGGLDTGAVDYILKPFAPDELIQRVKELVEQGAGAPAASPPAPKASAPRKAPAKASPTAPPAPHKPTAKDKAGRD